VQVLQDGARVRDACDFHVHGLPELAYEVHGHVHNHSERQHVQEQQHHKLEQKNADFSHRFLLAS
jgi:hypothetical protein